MDCAIYTRVSTDNQAEKDFSSCEAQEDVMTPCYMNKRKEERLKRCYYYRCTKTFKMDWDSCSVRQVNADRLEN